MRVNKQTSSSDQLNQDLVGSTVTPYNSEYYELRSNIHLDGSQLESGTKQHSPERRHLIKNIVKYKGLQR